MDSGFKKQEHLKSSLSIQDLLEQGRTVSSFPLKIYWKTAINTEQSYPVRVAFSVPKKKFRNAVDRNLMKRRIRESYRKHKQPLFDLMNKSNCRIVIIILYLSGEFISYQQVESHLKSALSKLFENIEKCD